jgi:uncharacterized protein YjbJ (UPF0337 family)
LARASLAVPYLFFKEALMAMRDTVKGAMRQVKGKGNDVMGAAKGDTSQQIKGKVQKAAGKVQEKIGRADSRATRNARGNPDVD